MRLIGLAIALFLLSTEVTAQATRVTSLSGRITDTAGAPIAGAEVTIPDLARRTLTSSTGAFRFDSVPAGGWVTRMRKVGFVPQTHTVDSDTGAVVFRLVPSPPTLAPVVTVAARLGLGGVVKDASDKPVPGARVRVLGIGLHTTTDSAGQFWVPAPAGSHMVTVAKARFAEKLAGVTVPADSGRNVAIWLRPAASIPPNEAHNVDDLRERIAWRGDTKSRPTFFTREDLDKEGIEWIYDLVQMMWRRAGHVTNINRECFVLINGGPAFVPLIGLTTDDVESVEVYSAWQTKSATVSAAAPRGPYGRGGEFVQPNNTYKIRHLNAGRTCMAVYVWLR